MTDQEVSEDHRASNPKNAISVTGQGNITEGACLSPYSGWHHSSFI